VSPKVKETKINDRTDIPNSYITKEMKFRSNEEISTIWCKPLKNFELTEDEKQILKENPKEASKLLFLTEESPCGAHILNMQLDKCFEKELGHTKHTLPRFFQCKSVHEFRFMHCQNKHRKWYNKRRDEINKEVSDSFKVELIDFEKYE